MSESARLSTSVQYTLGELVARRPIQGQNVVYRTEEGEVTFTGSELKEIAVLAYNAAMGNELADPEAAMLREVEALAATLRDRAEYHLEMENPTDKSIKGVRWRDDDSMRHAARGLSDKLLDLKRLRNERLVEKLKRGKEPA